MKKPKSISIQATVTFRAFVENSAEETEVQKSLSNRLKLALTTHPTLSFRVVRIKIPGKGVKSLAEVEKQHILEVLDLNEGNQARTAVQLGIGTATLYRRLKLYGLTKSRQGDL